LVAQVRFEQKSKKELPMQRAASSRIEVIIDPQHIHYLCSILEAYEGLAVLTTLDPLLGRVQLAVAPGGEGDIERILGQEANHIKLRRIQSGSGLSGTDKALENPYQVD